MTRDEQTRELAKTILAQLYPEVDDEGRPYLPYAESLETIVRLSAALSIEQTQPVKVKALEWDEFSTTARRHFQSNTILGQFQVSYLGEFECWQLYSPQKSTSWKENFSRHASSEAAKAAAQQDYETRILSTLVNAQADADVVEIPAEPTDEMIEAGEEEIASRRSHGCRVYAADIWGAMVASRRPAEVGSATNSPGSGGGDA